MISTMFEASIRVVVLDDVHVGVQRVDRLLGGVDLRHADAVGRVDHLALQVGEVDDVVVDDPERADAGGREVQRGRRAEPAGAEQQHLRVEQLLLALGADLGDQHVARVALALLGGERARDLDLVAAVLPQRDPAGHRARRARSRGPRSACARRRPSGCRRRSRGSRCGGAVGDDALDARLQVARGARAWRRAGGRSANSSVSRTSTIATPSSISSLTSDGSTSSIWLLTWRRSSAPDGLIVETPKPRSGFRDFTKYSAVARVSKPVARRSVTRRPTARRRLLPHRSPIARRAASAGARRRCWRARRCACSSAARSDVRAAALDRVGAGRASTAPRCPPARPARELRADRPERPARVAERATAASVVVLDLPVLDLRRDVLVIAAADPRRARRTAAPGAGADRQRRPRADTPAHVARFLARGVAERARALPDAARRAQLRPVWRAYDVDPGERRARRRSTASRRCC